MVGGFQALLVRGLVGLFLLGCTAWAGPPEETGDSLLRNWSPKEYGAEAQNWALAQSTDGLIYVGNNLGVMEFDGTRWRLIPMPKKTTVRSLGLGQDGRIYVGTVGDLGYLEGRGQGETRFVSLLPKLDARAREFSDIWVTTPTPRGMLFQSRECLLLFDGNRFQRWQAETTFHIAFVVDDRIFVRQRELGLMELHGDRLNLVPGGERFAKESVFAMLSMGPGRVFIGSRNQGCFLLEAGAMTRFPTEADSFLKKNPLYSGLRLQDGTLALATTGGGVVFLNPQGRIRHRLNRASGLQAENVKALFVDRQSGLWLALDHGLSRVEWPSPFSQLDERHGLKGNVWAIHRHRGTLCVATGQGLFTLARARDRAIFKAVEGVQVQNLRFLSVDDHLLVANGQGVFELGPDGVARVVRLSSNVAISLTRSRKDPARVFVGLQGGLASLRWDGTRGWRDEGLIPGLSDDYYSLVEDAQGDLWLGSSARGIFRVQFPEGWTGGASKKVQVQRFDVNEGLPASVNNQVVEIQGQVVALTVNGLYLLHPGRTRFEVDPRFSGLFAEGTRWVQAIQMDDTGRILMATTDQTRRVSEVGWALPQSGGAYKWDPSPFLRFRGVDIVSLLCEPDGALWFGGPTGMLRWDPTLSQNAAEIPATLVRRVGRLGQDSAPEVTQGSQLPYADNALRFEFASPSFEVAGANHYQVFLEGLDKTWSSWGPETQKDYTNLPQGTYTFRVRSKDLYGRVSAEGRFAFGIQPPWYLRWWALGAYFAGFFGLIRLSYQMRTRILRERNRELELRVNDSTLELQRQAHELATANAELRALDEQKNQFLGIVAHDLRNPLQGILMTAEMIYEENDPEEIRRRALQIVKQGTGMSQLVGRFLDVAALESGKVSATLEQASMTSLVSEVVERHAARAEEKDICLVQILPDGACHCWIDPKLTGNALDNLVSNALKFSPRGRTITLQVSEFPGVVQARVVDQGPGFTPEDKAKLFGRFTPLSARPTDGEKSVGLGLSITKQLVELSAGRIWVESEPGQGATFFVEFPSHTP